MHAFPLFAAAAPDYWPFLVLVLSVALIIFLITMARIHAFMALILAAITAGLLARSLPGEPGKSHWVQAVELTTSEFGLTAGKIGVVIALAAIIGMCLMESGAADKVVRRFLAAFGEKRAGAAIFVSGYVLSIPIFFDTFFMLLLPLAVAMRLRTGKDYVLYVMSICCGGVVTHSLVAPHPGPLTMAEVLKIDLGLTIMVGIAVGIIPATISWLVTKHILNPRLDIPLRESGSVSLADCRAIIDKPESELPSFFWSILPVILPIVLISAASTFVAIQSRNFEIDDVKDPAALLAQLKAREGAVAQHLESKLSVATRTALTNWQPGRTAEPGLVRAVLGDFNQLMRAGVLYDAPRFAGVTLRPETAALRDRRLQSDNLTRWNRMLIEDAFPGALLPTRGMSPTLFTWGEFLGNRNIALLIGAVIAIAVLVRQQRGLTLAKVGEMIGPPFETAGVIILITSAGGAFGLMLKNAGVGDAVQAWAEGRNINLLLLAYAVAAVIRVAQGSATVAMLTTSAMIYPMTVSSALPYHPVYLFMAIGFGAMILSWMNDSGFWVVGRLSGFTEKETLKTWTVVVTVNSIAGLMVVLLLSWLFPFRPA